MHRDSRSNQSLNKVNQAVFFVKVPQTTHQPHLQHVLISIEEKQRLIKNLMPAQRVKQMLASTGAQRNSFQREDDEGATWFLQIKGLDAFLWV